MLYLEKDKKEIAKIERRRQLEEERKKRYFDPKIRLLGVDVKAWEKQIAEKQATKNEEHHHIKTYYEQKKREDVICMGKEKILKTEEQEVMNKIGDFRKTMQRFEDRREFDLNDPLYKKKMLPARLHDDDPRCTISSAQMFEGEDLQSSERLKIQSQQTKAWLSQQIHEKRMNEEEKKKAEELYQDAVLRRDRRAVELNRIEQECIRRMQQTNAQFNKALGEERTMLKKQWAEREASDKMAEQHNWLTGDFLTENPHQAASNFGPHRLMPDRYKGEPKTRAMETTNLQKMQILEKQRRMDEDKALEAAWVQLKNDLRRKVYLQDKEVMRQQREINNQLLKTNRNLAQEKQERDQHFKKYVNVNVPTERFFDQFNRSTNF